MMNEYEYEYLTGKEILHFGPRQMIEWTKFTKPSLGKAFKKQLKRI